MNVRISDDNEPLSAFTHLLGFTLSIAALVLMVVFAAIHDSPARVVGASIFGSSLILLYAASTTFHFLGKGHPLKYLFQRLDHAMIFVLIAGTYTPIMLTLPSPGWGWSLFGLNWGLAILGVTAKLTGKTNHRAFSAVLSLVMGWLTILAWPYLHDSLGSNGLFWLLLGGVLYTVGVVFYALDNHVKRTHWFSMHEVFHLFVLAGSFSHFWLVLRFV